jgi:hypothetical protein
VNIDAQMHRGVGLAPESNDNEEGIPAALMEESSI